MHYDDRMINDALTALLNSYADPNCSLHIAIRDYLINNDDLPDFADDPEYARPALMTLFNAARPLIDALDTHDLSMMRLDHSLCPLHAIDYAICFDDDDPDCAAIRDLFPHHDT